MSPDLEVFSAPEVPEPRAGRSDKQLPEPPPAELLRLRVMDVLARRLPVAMRLADDRVLTRLENDLDAALERGLLTLGYRTKRRND